MEQTEAQKALGIKPIEMTEEEKAQDAALAKADETEDDPFTDDLNSEPTEEVDEDEKKTEEETEKPEVEEEEKSKPEKTVPLDLHLDEKRKRKEAEEKLAKYEEANGETERKEAIKAMAEDLGIDAEAAEKLFVHMEKIAAAKAAKEPEEKETSTEDNEAAEKAHFNSEYDDFADEFSKLYPNATPQMRKEAKQKLYELARSEQYGIVPGKHDAYPLDYIVTKERKTFDTLLKVAPKDKSGESSRDMSKDDDFEEIDFTDPTMSPARYQQYQQQRQARRAKATGVKFI